MRNPSSAYVEMNPKSFPLDTRLFELLSFKISYKTFIIANIGGTLLESGV